MRISDWSSDVCSSDLNRDPLQVWKGSNSWMIVAGSPSYSAVGMTPNSPLPAWKTTMQTIRVVARLQPRAWAFERDCDIVPAPVWRRGPSPPDRSEEHTSELQSLMRISSGGFCVTKKKQQHK